MARRTDLHAKLVAMLGSNYVYFQPPESIKLTYPCIVYKRTTATIKFADDKVYNYRYAYEITIIDKNPDSNLVDKMFSAFPLIRFNRHFTADNLNHDVFTVYY